MKASSKLALGIAFVVAFLAEGVPYWRIPYSQASLPSSLYRPGLVVVFVMAAGCRWIARTRILVDAARGRRFGALYDPGPGRLRNECRSDVAQLVAVRGGHRGVRRLLGGVRGVAARRHPEACSSDLV